MPKRRFFQIHLSTAVVLMLVAGVFLWANVQPKWIRFNDPAVNSIPPDWPRFSRTDWNAYGWPLKIKWAALRYLPQKQIVIGELYSQRNAFLNLLTALAIVLAVWQLCEWRIRRRSAMPRREGSAVPLQSTGVHIETTRDDASSG